MTVVIPSPHRTIIYVSRGGRCASSGPIVQAMLLDGLPTYFLNPIFYVPGIWISKKFNIFPIIDPLIASLDLICIIFQPSRPRLNCSFCTPSLSTFLKTSFQLIFKMWDAQFIHALSLPARINRGGGMSTRGRRLGKPLLEDWLCHQVVPFSLGWRFILRIR